MNRFDEGRFLIGNGLVMSQTIVRHMPHFGASSCNADVTYFSLYGNLPLAINAREVTSVINVESNNKIAKENQVLKVKSGE